MMISPREKYKAYAPVPLVDRTWPENSITKAPVWCSVDLRDGNQSLIEPMGPDRKMRMFNALLKMGFKEIEIGFPSASQTDFDFCRYLIENNKIPDGVIFRLQPKDCFQLIFHRGAKPRDASAFHFEDHSGLIKLINKDRGVISNGKSSEFEMEKATVVETVLAWMQATA